MPGAYDGILSVLGTVRFTTFFWTTISTGSIEPTFSLAICSLKVGMGVGLFLISALVLLIIALLTVSYRTYTAARANPVEALKTE